MKVFAWVYHIDYLQMTLAYYGHKKYSMAAIGGIRRKGEYCHTVSIDFPI